MRKMMRGTAAAALAAIFCWGASTDFAVAAGNSLLPFWAQPYPSYYAYGPRQPDPSSCYDWQTVEGPFGPTRRRVFICDGLVVERY